MHAFSAENKRRIRAKANDLRMKHCAMEWGANAEILIECEGLHYEEYNLDDEGFLGKITRPIKKIAQKIKAAFIPKENAVLIDQELHPAKKPFGQAHELGHHAIPEHKEILYVCSENDLNPYTRRQMEFEANIFAAEILFPEYLLNNIFKEFPLSMNTILYLSDQSEASIHSSAIQYVKSNDRVCCLLTFTIKTDINNEKLLLLENQIYSKPWKNEFRGKAFPKYWCIKKEHPIAHAILTEGKGKILEIPLKGQSRNFKAQTMYNGYNGFALIF